MYDVFVSYASEDQMTVVEPLVAGLRNLGISVWYAPLVLLPGDHLRRSLDLGIARSRYGIVVLSPAFFGKHWTQYELDGLAQMEVEGRKVILPLWYEIEATELRQRSLSLADRIAVRWSNGLQKVLADLLSVIRPHEKSERRYQLERLAFNRLFHLQNATVPAVRLVGAATEHFPVDTISIALDSAKYAMPEPFAARRAALVATLEEEVRQREGSVFNGPSVRMSDYAIEYQNVASERKHIKLVLSQL